MRRLILLLLTLALSGCGIPAGAGTWIESKLYSGNGHISTCSTVFAAGYCIDFPPFDASLPHVASYRLSRVPQVARDPYLKLCFHREPRTQPWHPGIEDELQRAVTATVHFTLLDDRGQEKRSLDLPLSSSLWGDSQNLTAVWNYDKGSFRFEPRRNYTLKVAYTPGSVPPPTKQVYVEVNCCATY